VHSYSYIFRDENRYANKLIVIDLENKIAYK